MAIINVTLPSILSLAYRPIVFTWESDAADLQYCIVETIIGGARVSATSVQPDLGTADEFTFNASSVAQNNLDFTLKTLGSSGVLTGDTGYGELSIKIYEVTESGGLLVTNYDPDDATNTNYDYWSGTSPSDSRNFYNWTESHFDYNNLSTSDYTLNGITKKFLSEAPLVKKIESNVNEFIGIFAHSGLSSQNFRLEILTYDSSNALLNTDVISITEWDSSYVVGPVNTYLSLGVGTANLIAAGVSLTNVAYYTIQIINNSGDVSELRRFNIEPTCDADVRVHWVNKFGKQEAHTFRGNTRHTLSHKASTYQNALGNTYSSDARGITVNQNISTDNFEVFTESIGQGTYDFLASMLVTKQAWIEDNGSYYPIIIDNGTKFIRDEEDIAVQFVLSYSYANPTKGIKG